MKNNSNNLLLFLTVLLCTICQCICEEDYFRVCQEKLHYSDADVQRFNKSMEVTTEADKCYLSCLYKVNEFIKDDKVDMASIKEYFDKEYKGDHKSELLNIFSVCSTQLKDIKETPECDLAVKLLACEKEELKKTGLSIYEI